MIILLRITGFNETREVVVDASGSEMILGRDASAHVQLIDPQKEISRKHLGIRAVRDGLELRVLSTLNGVDTSRGVVPPSELITLTIGDTFTLGPYVIELAAGAPTAQQAPAPTARGDDPFATLLGQDTRAYDNDRFARPEFAATPQRDSADPFALLSDVAPAAPARGASPLGNLLGSTKTPDGAAGSGQNAAANPGTDRKSIDDILRSGPTASPLATNLGAPGPLDDLLGRRAQVAPRALSPDHVDTLNFPMSADLPAAQTAAQMSAHSATPRTSAAATLPDDDAWSRLEKLGAADKDSAEVTDAPRRSAAPAPTDQPSGAALPDLSIFDRLNTQAAQPPGPENSTDAVKQNVFDDDWLNNSLGQAPVPAATSESVPLAINAAQTAPVESTNERISAPDVWEAFVRGLQTQELSKLDARSAERAGLMVRVLLEGLSELLAARADLKRELGAGERTRLGGQDNNPLKAGLSANEMIQYLFAAPIGGGYMPAERAVRESVSELLVHEGATIAALRAALEGTIRDFDPAKLKALLLKGAKSSVLQLLDHARLWDGYQAHYEKKAQHMADWLEEVIDRYFVGAYEESTENAKRR